MLLNFFMALIFERAKWAIVLVLGRPFQPYLLIVGYTLD